MLTVFWDFLGLAGIVLVLAGLWMIWPPLALVVGGLAMIGGALLGSRLWASSPPSGTAKPD